MKQTFFIFACIFAHLFISAQTTYNADVSITAMTLVSADKPQTAVIVDPNVNKLPTLSTNNLSRITIPVDEKPLPWNFKGSITVHNDSINQGNETYLIIILPPRVIAGTTWPNAIVQRDGPSNYFDSYILFNLGKLSKGQTLTVDYGFQRATEFTNKVYAFIFSNSADPNFRNNMKEISF